ncbi:MAG TPA: hypothetical protein VFV95_08900 [Vicinamibacterales bacterium]|nr:hypothetical protein [Vicinamibacterales bacterium]
MRDRQLSLLALAGALGLVSFFGSSMIAQAPAPQAKPAAPATAKPATAKPATGVKVAAIRTPWGDPDLQGTWFVTEDVPIERSAANVGKQFLTDEEVAAADKRKAEGQGRNTRAGSATTADVEGAYNAVFNSILKTGKRTSRIIDPPDGCIPPTVGGAQGGGGGRGGGCIRDGAAPAPAAAAAPARGGAAAARGGAPGAPAAAAPAARGAAPATAGRGAGGGRGQANDNPEQIAQNPRCLGVTLPFLPVNTQFAQGTVMQIVQSPKSMSIYMEDDHAGGGNRVIYIDGRPHPPASMKLYLGDSRGHWEGNTLVVETTNFAQAPAIGFGGGRGGSPDSAKLIERYTRTGPNDLRRELTFDDPKTWTRPFTLLVEMGKVSDDKHMIFESACHEGNYGMTGILVGARLEERAAAAKGQK